MNYAVNSGQPDGSVCHPIPEDDPTYAALLDGAEKFLQDWYRRNRQTRPSSVTS